MIDDIKKHKGHDIVDQFVLVTGEKKWFKYCRDCKCEVEEKDNRIEVPTEEELLKEIDKWEKENNTPWWNPSGYWGI